MTSASAPLRLRKLDSLEVMRGVAALLVVLFHVEAIIGERAGLRPLGGWFGVGRTGVDLFFVLSGFIMAYVHEHDVGRPASIGRYAISRVTRIYPSVWVMSAFAACVYLAGFGGGGKAAKLAPAHLLPSLLLLPQRAFPLVNVTWTLTYEMFFYAVFGLCILNRRLGVAVMIVWQAAVLLLAVAGVAPQNVVPTAYLQPFCAQFGLGILCALLCRRAVPSRVGVGVLRAAFAAGVISFIGGLVYGAIDPYGLTSLENLAVFGLGAAAMVTSAATLELRGALRPLPAALVALGTASYSVYLVHYSAVTIIVVALIRFGVPPGNAVVALGIAAAAVLAGCLFHVAVDRPMHRAIQRGLRRRRDGRSAARAPLLPLEPQPTSDARAAGRG